MELIRSYSIPRLASGPVRAAQSSSCPMPAASRSDPTSSVPTARRWHLEERFTTLSTISPPGPGRQRLTSRAAMIWPTLRDACCQMATSLSLPALGFFKRPGSFFVFDGITFTPAPNTQSGHSLTSYQSRMLLLPTGQVLWVTAEGSTTDTEIYTSPGGINPAWRPTITSVPATLTRGASYQISGTQFNGLSVGADYGDDATMATNYPLVRITNEATRSCLLCPDARPQHDGNSHGKHDRFHYFRRSRKRRNGCEQNRCRSQRNSVEAEAGHDPVIGECVVLRESQVSRRCRTLKRNKSNGGSSQR